MKLDADEKQLLDSVDRGKWKSAKVRQSRANALHPIREGHVVR